MTYQCSYCKTMLSSEKKLNVHLVFAHEMYKTGEYIQEAAIRSLERISDRALFLMIKYPECRKPEPEHIWLKYIQVFQGSMVWDQQHQGYMIRDSTNVLKHEQARFMLRELESVRRTAQKLKAKDKKNHLSDGTMLPHQCILPSEADQQKAILREEAIRNWAVR